MLKRARYRYAPLKGTGIPYVFRSRSFRIRLPGGAPVHFSFGCYDRYAPMAELPDALALGASLFGGVG